MRQIPKIPHLAGLNPGAEPAVIDESIMSGRLSRNEVLQRAQYWVDRGVIHGEPDAPDRRGHRYPTDGAGLVSSAWCLDGSPLASQLLASALNGVANLRVVHLDDLRPGDALARDTGSADGDGHIALFAFWKDLADPRKGAYVYALESRGETVRNPYAPSNLGNLGFYDWSEIATCIFIRYDNVVETLR